MKEEILSVFSRLMCGLDHWSCFSSSLSRLSFRLLCRPLPLSAASSKTDSLESVLRNPSFFDFALSCGSSSRSRSVLRSYHCSTSGVYDYDYNLSYSGVSFRRTGAIFRWFSNSPLSFCPGKQEIVEELEGICGGRDGSGGEGDCFPVVDTTCSEPNVMVEVTKNKLADYKTWVREHSSSRNHFEEARDMLAKMRQIGLEPSLNLSIYNPMISYFCKYGAPEEANSIVEEMIKSGLAPNALTYDILICHFCRAEDMKSAIRLYDHMVCEGIEPRLSTNSAIIRGYFDSGQYITAYNFVIDANVISRSSANKNYSVLASLHQRSGNLYVAYTILLEMVGKGLKPDNGVYRKVLRMLFSRKKKDFAENLKSRLDKLIMHRPVIK